MEIAFLKSPRGTAPRLPTDTATIAHLTRAPSPSLASSFPSLSQANSEVFRWSPVDTRRLLICLREKLLGISQRAVPVREQGAPPATHLVAAATSTGRDLQFLTQIVYIEQLLRLRYQRQRE